MCPHSSLSHASNFPSNSSFQWEDVCYRKKVRKLFCLGYYGLKKNFASSLLAHINGYSRPETILSKLSKFSVSHYLENRHELKILYAKLLDRTVIYSLAFELGLQELMRLSMRGSFFFCCAQEMHINT